VRQKYYNLKVLALTLSALESVTGRESPTGSREEKAKQWSQWWEKENSKQGAAHDAANRN
jgi:hypothetical protein